jgi:hypothetical protein
MVYTVSKLTTCPKKQVLKEVGRELKKVSKLGGENRREDNKKQRELLRAGMVIIDAKFSVPWLTATTGLGKLIHVPFLIRPCRHPSSHAFLHLFFRHFVY